MAIEKSDMPLRRRRLRRGAAIVLGFSFFLVFELVLRATNAGPSFEQSVIKLRNPIGIPMFDISHEGGRSLWQTSPVYQYKSNQVSFETPKPKHTYRIMVLGASTTAGFPFWGDAAFPRWLEVMLNAQYSLYKYEVINCGALGLGSHEIKLLLPQVLQADPDLIVVYMGHNECIRDYVHGANLRLSSLLVRWHCALMHLRSYRLLSEVLNEHREDDSAQWQRFYPRKRLAGKRPEKDVPFWSEEDREIVRKIFRKNLETIISSCREKGVGLVLCTTQSNLRDFAPGGAVNGTSLFPDEKTRWEMYSAVGTDAFSRGRYDEALSNFKKALAIDDGDALIRYLCGRSLLKLEKPEAARKEFMAALDRDDYPLRALSSVNREIRNAARGRGVLLADVESAFADSSVFKIPGNEWNLDHVHPRVEGHRLIAMVIMEAMVADNLVAVNNDWRALAERAGDLYLKKIPPDFLSGSYLSLAENQESQGRIKMAIGLCRLALLDDPGNERAAAMLRMFQKRYANINTYE